MKRSKLNINKAIKKSSKAKLELYDRLYDIGNFLLNKHNPCSIKKGTCNGPYTTSFCCDDCKYLTAKGCTVKALRCKLWLCHTVPPNKHPNKIVEQFDRLSHIASINGLIIPRGSKSDVSNKVNGLYITD